MAKSVFTIILLLALMYCPEGFSANKKEKKKMELINPDSIPESRKIYYKTDDWKPVKGIDTLFTEAKVLYNTYHNQGVIIFDREITKIPKDAFLGQEITEITLPENVQSIGEFAFSVCDKLRKIGLPSGLRTIEENAFNSCVELYSITIPESVESIATGAFESCYALQKFSGKFASSDGRCLIDGNRLIAVAVKGLKEFTIPANIKIIDMDSASWFTNSTDNAIIVYCKAQTPPQCSYNKDLYERIFRNSDVGLASILYVPASSLELYENDPVWSRFKIVGYVF